MIPHLATCDELSPLFLGQHAMPANVAYLVYLALRRGHNLTRKAAEDAQVEKAWDYTMDYVAEGIRICREIIGDRLRVPTFGYWRTAPHIVEDLKGVDYLPASRTSELSKVFRSMMNG